MSEIMRPIPFANLVKWIQAEYQKSGSVFGIRDSKFYRKASGKKTALFGMELGSPIGPAAGPHSQLAQNIVAAYLAGSRFFELKTVQTLDGEDMRKCIARPCIYAADEGYNVEWSTELTVQEAYGEYVKAWFLIHVCAKEFGLSAGQDFLFNMSVGYNLEGIQSEKIDAFIEGMKNAASSPVWKDCCSYLATNIGNFSRFTKADLDAINPVVASSVTLSTLHGCPKEEIEKIALYLLTQKHIHTYIKCNPSLLGYENTRKILDDMGFRAISFDDHHFKDDLQYADALDMLNRLQKTANEQNLAFGVKITNTFPVEIKRKELPGEEMYMSGRALFPLSINVARKLAADFNGSLPISYSGGADFFNLAAILETGIRPVTICTTMLKPGGYERISQLAELAEKTSVPDSATIDAVRLERLATGLPGMERYHKEYRRGTARKTASPLALFDCAKAPCEDGGCPVNQQIPAYLEKVAAGDYEDAFKIILIDNPLPSITGTSCYHECEKKCTRIDYDESLHIRAMKKLAADKAQDAYIASVNPAPLKTEKSVGIIGAGPAGVATAVFLRRNGVPVIVYEKNDKPFGKLCEVIPEFKDDTLPLEKDFNLARKIGVEFKFGVVEAYSIDALKKNHEFIVLAPGSLKSGAENRANVQLSEKGHPEINGANESSSPNVYIAGDYRGGPASVVRAMADGKKIAKDILRKLNLPHDFVKVAPTKKDTTAIYDKRGVLASGVEGNEDSRRCLSCNELCRVCAEVCPNRANFVVKTGAPFAHPRQVVHIDTMCNECGNCTVFCPHEGAPYKNKFTVFSCQEDFKDSENIGFYADNGGYTVRLADKSVVHYKTGGTNIPAELAALIDTLANDYSYLLIQL
jgi:putative selenate reductase